MIWVTLESYSNKLPLEDGNKKVTLEIINYFNNATIRSNRS